MKDFFIFQFGCNFSRFASRCKIELIYGIHQLTLIDYSNSFRQLNFGNTSSPKALFNDKL